MRLNGFILIAPYKIAIDCPSLGTLSLRKTQFRGLEDLVLK